MDGATYRFGVDNSQVQAGIAYNERLIEAHIKRVQGMTGSLALGNALNFVNGGIGQIDRFNSRLGQTIGLGGRLNQTLDRMSNIFTTGLGIGATLGGLTLLERAFTRSIEKARQFQTAHLAIAATLQSSYKVVGSNGKEIQGYQGFQVAKAMGETFNQQIIERQARNILVYQEQLGAFQSSIAAGARKGLTPNQVLDTSEQAAIVAKTLGLRGEQIANASRLLMGGGVNVGRSSIGRALGVSNQDISSRSGQDFVDFLQSKMKGFKAAEPDFAKSIEGILSTLEAKFDIFFAKVGSKFMTKIGPSLQEFTKAFEGPKAEEFADTLADLFKQIFDSLKMIIDSGALTLVVRFLEFLAKWGKDIAIAGVILGVVSAVSNLVRGLASTVTMLREVSAEAIKSALALNATAEAATAAGTATGGMGAVGGMGMAARGARAAGAAGLPAMTAQMEATALQNLHMTQGMGGKYWQTPGTGGVSNFKQYNAKYQEALAAERAATQTSYGNMAASGAYIGPGYTPMIVPSAREMMGKIAQEKGLFSKASFTYAKGTTIGALPKVAMGAMAGALAGQFVQSQTNQMQSPVAQSAGNALATAMPIAAGVAMIPGVGLPAAAAILGVVTALKMLNDALVNTRKKIEDATEADKAQYARIKGKAAKPFAEDADKAAAIAPFEDAIKTAEQDIADMKARTQNKVMDKATASKFWRFFGVGNKERKFGEPDASGTGGETDKMLPMLNKDLTAAQKNLDELNKLKGAKLTMMEQTAEAENLKERRWALPGEETNPAGTLFPNVGFGTAYRRDYKARYEESLMDTLSAAETELAKQKLDPAAMQEALLRIRDKFDADYNMPLKELQARIEGLSLGDKTENAAKLAKLAFEVTENKIREMSQIYGDLIDAAGMKRQAAARRDVDIMTAKDTDRQRAILGSTPEERIRNEGNLDIYSKQLGRTNVMNEAFGNKYAAQLGGIYDDFAKKLPTTFGGDPNKAQAYLRARLETFQPQMQLDYLGQGQQLNTMTRQRASLVREHPWQLAERQANVQAAGFGLEKAQLAQNMYAGNVGPQFQDAAAAIRYSVDAKMAAAKGFKPEEYKKDYTRLKEIEQSEMDTAIKLADINKQRVESSTSIVQIENDYQTSLKELTIRLTEAGKQYGVATKDVAITQGAINKALNTGSKVPTEKVVARVDKITAENAAGPHGYNEGVTNNVPVTIEGKLSMTDAEVASMANKVRDKIIQECSRTQARK